jgi:hypothetical protein
VFLRQLHNLAEEQVCHLMAQQPLLVLAEGRGIEHRLVERKIDKPAEHQVGLKPRTELPVTPHREQSLQHLRFEQPLRRDRRTPLLHVHLIKVSIHALKHLVDQRLDSADRVLGRDQALDIDQADKVRLGGGLAAHCITSMDTNRDF